MGSNWSRLIESSIGDKEEGIKKAEIYIDVSVLHKSIFGSELYNICDPCCHLDAMGSVV